MAANFIKDKTPKNEKSLKSAIMCWTEDLSLRIRLSQELKIEEIKERQGKSYDKSNDFSINF